VYFEIFILFNFFKKYRVKLGNSNRNYIFLKVFLADINSLFFWEGEEVNCFQAYVDI